MDNRTYWAKRSQVREAKAYSNCLETTRGLVNAYRQTAANIRREINDFYGRFARENKIEYSDAVRLLNKSEMLEWNNTVAGYIEEIRREKNPEVRERLMREYDARAYGARITRLESLNGSIDNELSKLYARANEQFRELLGENYTDGYYRTIFDIQNRFGYSSMFATVNAEVVENALSYPWSGANFSDRLWKHNVELLNNLRETLTTGFIRGDSVQTMAKRLAERLDASRSNALRLIRTESSHIHNTAELDAYKECGFEEYEFMASLGERTCEVCGGMDGKRIKLTDKQFGVNFPPLHPNCRCTTIAFDPDDDLSDFKAGELEYEQWYAKYVEGREQPKLESKDGAEVSVPGGKPVPAAPSSGEIKLNRNFLNPNEPFDVSDDVISQVDVKSSFIPAKTIQEAEEYAVRYIETRFGDKTFKGMADFKGVSLEHANDINRALSDVFDKYDIPKISGIKAIDPNSAKGRKIFTSADAVMAYSPVEHGVYLNKSVLKSPETLAAYNKQAQQAWDTVMNNINSLTGAQRETALRYKNAGRSLVGNGSARDYFVHEMGHHIQWEAFDANTNNAVGSRMSQYAGRISGYATASKSEYFAESFAAFEKGELDKLDPDFVAFLRGKSIDKSAKSGIMNNTKVVIHPDKINRFCLKPDAKHADDFFNVGYTTKDYDLLYNDIVENFDENSIVDVVVSDSGAVKFSVFMDLGVGTKKRFRTVWQKDTAESAPRFITAHRED